MALRDAIAILLAMLLSACASEWESNPPTSETGGTGMMADGRLAQGPGAVSSVSELPASNHSGIQPPFGAKGTAAAYEYDSGYRLGAGDRLTVRVAGETISPTTISSTAPAIFRCPISRPSMSRA